MIIHAKILGMLALMISDAPENAGAASRIMIGRGLVAIIFIAAIVLVWVK